jgi:hypothetical protein
MDMVMDILSTSFFATRFGPASLMDSFREEVTMGGISDLAGYRAAQWAMRSKKFNKLSKFKLMASSEQKLKKL